MLATNIIFECSMFRNKNDNQPTYRGKPWDEIALALTQHKERKEKDGALWSPAVYKGKATRGNAGVDYITAAVGDFDDGTDYEAIKDRFTQYEYVVHSTHTHTPEHPKYRVIIPFAERVAVQDWPNIKASIDEHIFGLANDPTAKDPARIYYTPSCLPKAERFSERHEGEMLNPYSLPAPSKPEYTPMPTSEGERGEVKVPLGKTALDFVANGAPLGEQRSRALAAARNYLSAGYSVDDTAAAIWRGLQASPQDPARGPWTRDDALFIVQNLDKSDAPPLDDLGPVVPRSELHREGLGYRFDFPSIGISVLINHIHRGSDFKGEIRVTASIPGIRRNVHWASLNMSSTSSRNTLVKKLNERTEGIRIDWDSIIEDICDKVATCEREGEPFIELDSLPEGLDTPWLIQNFAPKGETTTIFGEGGSGKSLTALALALSVQTGVTFVPGYEPMEQGNVLYLDWETNNVRIARRSKMLTDALDLPVSKVTYRHCTRPMADQVEEVLRRCQEKNVVLVVIDSVEMAMAGTRENGGDANDPILRLHAALRTLNVTTLLVDHVNKASSGQNGKRNPYGGIFKTNLARMEYELRKIEGSRKGLLKLALLNTKRNDDGVPFDPVGLRCEFEFGTVRYYGDAKPPITPAQDALMTLRIAAQLQYGDMTIGEVSEAIKADANSVGVTMRRLETAHQVEKRGRKGRADLWHLLDTE